MKFCFPLQDGGVHEVIWRSVEDEEDHNTLVIVGDMALCNFKPTILEAVTDLIKLGVGQDLEFHWVIGGKEYGVLIEKSLNVYSSKC
jgi:hypothetical protein